MESEVSKCEEKISEGQTRLWLLWSFSFSLVSALLVVVVFGVSWPKILKKQQFFLFFGHAPRRLGSVLGASRERLGRVLGRLGRVLGASWAPLGPSWGRLGGFEAVLGRLGPALRRLKVVRRNDPV